MGTSPAIKIAIFMFLNTGGQNWPSNEILSGLKQTFRITFKSWFVFTNSPYRARQRNSISMYSFYIRTFLSHWYVLLQYLNLMYTVPIIWWCIFSLLYTVNHESHTSPMPLVLGSFYYTSQTEPCLHGPFLFFKTCSSISDLATKGGEVQMWNIHTQKRGERERVSKERSIAQVRTATAWSASHFRGPRPILGKVIWDF